MATFKRPCPNCHREARRGVWTERRPYSIPGYTEELSWVAYDCPWCGVLLQEANPHVFGLPYAGGRRRLFRYMQLIQDVILDDGHGDLADRISDVLKVTIEAIGPPSELPINRFLNRNRNEIEGLVEEPFGGCELEDVEE